jgi:predicted dienelactone hydrolase
VGSAIGGADRFAPRAPATAAAAATNAGTVFAMAPARAPAFLPESLGRIEIPVAIVAGTADAIVSVGSSARTYAGISGMPS